MWLFACCGRRERAPAPEAGVGFGYGCDERTPLIQDSPEEAAALARRLDEQRMKERLENIVRAKKGNMVNVNSQIPFNLHNQNLNAHHSSSRSNSNSGNSHSNLYYNAYNQPGSRSASCSTLGDDEDDGAIEEERPILNVRLVYQSGVGPVHRGRRASSSRTRGRSGLVRLEGSGRRGSEEAEDRTAEKKEQGQADEDRGAEGEQGDVDADADLVTPRPPAQIPPWAPTTGADAASPPGEQNAPAPAYPSALTLRLQQAGAISRSWGD